MSNSVNDRRVQKTRQLLKDALVAIILEKGFEEASIKEILDRANVGRSTFYIHYENKYELLHSCFEDFCELLEQHKSRMLKDRNYHGNFTLNLFRLVEQNHRLFKAFFKNEGLAVLNHPITEYIYSYIDEALKSTPGIKKNPLKFELLKNYLTNALNGTIKWWVFKDMPCSAEDLYKYFKLFSMKDMKDIVESESIQLF